MTTNRLDLDRHDIDARLAFTAAIARRWCWTYDVSHPADIDDVRQEANVAVLLAMKTYDPRRPLKPFLFTCIYRRLFDWARKRPSIRRQAVPKLRDRYRARRLGTSVDTNLIDLKHVACTWLTDEERVLLELLLSGQTAREIAGGRGCTRACIYDATRRLVRRLRSLLADLED
jgi:RNA polymerase sigma factor (sigma-70 family)